MNFMQLLFAEREPAETDLNSQRKAFASLRREMQWKASARQNVDLDKRVAELEKENDEIRLYLVALIRYLANKEVVQKEEFRQYVDIVDIEDGTTDGAYKGDILK